jgi:hypothetical protein
MTDKVSIITTTINGPSFLHYFFKNFKDNNINLDNIKFIVVGDRKTPDIWNRTTNSHVEYWDIEAQDNYLDVLTKDKTLRAKLFPENNMLRRNFGYLRAIELGSDVTITVDDDNLPINCNFIGEHLDALHNKNVESVHTNNKLFNHCSMMKMNHSVYPRGYPFDKMFDNEYSCSKHTNKLNVMLNMGLWTNKPDVDATYSIIYPDLNSEEKQFVNNVAMEKDTYFSVNTQNTAIKGDAKLIFHNLYMDTIGDYKLHRYDDIWSGLLTLKCIHANGDTASVGNPVVEHRRNTHNYSKDLATEYLGLNINSRIWKFIQDLDIGHDGYTISYLKLAGYLCNMDMFEQSINNYFKNLGLCMIEWIKLTDKVR